MEAVTKIDDHMTSPAAFVEGGVQEACDDACSICLEDFCQSDPSTVTSCKHGFHLQCILEWCQRSSNCPMCWQPISLRDATSQELLEAMEEERDLRSNRLRNASMFHHPSVVDFDLRHTLQLPMDASQVQLEEHIFQHLAAAAAGRGRHVFQSEGQGNWSSSQGHRPFFIFSAPNAPNNNAVWSSTNPGAGSESVGGSLGRISTSHPSSGHDQVPTIPLSGPQTHQASVHRFGSNVGSVDQRTISSETRNFSSRPSRGNQETGEQSDLLSLSDSLRSRLNTWSMRYKDSISRNTRGWKERLFSRSTSVAEVGSDVRREVNAGIASVSRLMERLDARENAGSRRATGSSNSSSRSNTSNLEHEMREDKVSAASAVNSASD